MNIQVLGAHNCEGQDLRFISLLIDDTLAIDAGGLTSSLSISAQLKLRTILLTHQHYDHVRDIPAIAMNFFLHGASINIYSTQPVHDALSAHLLNGKLYPKFLEQPPENPAVKFSIIEPYQTEQIEGYSVLAIPVKHSELTIGFQVTSRSSKAVFYTADTGPGLAECWQHVSPQLLITEVTAPDKYKEWAAQTGHLTPGLLRQELTDFQKCNGYLPQVVVVHMNPRLEKEIETEIAAVAEALSTPIALGYEGMQLHL